MDILIGRVKKVLDNKVVQFYVNNAIDDAIAYPLFTLREPREEDELVIFSICTEFHSTYLYTTLSFDNESIDMNILGLHIVVTTDNGSRVVEIKGENGEVPTAIPDKNTPEFKGIFNCQQTCAYTGLPIRSNTFKY